MTWGEGAPPRSDIVLAAGLGAIAVTELFAPYALEHSASAPPAVVYVPVAVVAGGLLSWRRVYPLVVSPAVWGLLALQAFTAPPPNVYGEIFIAIVALYSLVVYAPTRRAVVAPAALSLGFAALLGTADSTDRVGAAVTNVVYSGLVIVAACVARQQRTRAERLRRERDDAAARARDIAVQERARIARELHDVVAHGMSVVVLQARGARRVLLSDPACSEQALNDIERVAANCLDEMRRLLGLLRDSEAGDVPLRPQPGLPDLEALVDQARSSGARVELVVQGKPRGLPPAVELSVYRIVQESLTNALRHAPGSRASVRLGYRDDAVEVEVTDDGPGRNDGESGHGLIGMRERAELFGGTFAAGDEPGGGFGVRARLPVGRRG